MAPKPTSASRNAAEAQIGGSSAARIASNVNCQLPPCMTPNDSRMPIAPRCAISRYRKPALTNLRDAMLRRDEKVRRQRHRLPRHHERVRVVGEQHGAHAARNKWYWRQSRPGSVPSPRRKYPAPKSEIPADAAPEQKQKHVAQRVAPQVHGEVGQTQAKHPLLGGAVMLRAAVAAMATPTAAPSGNRTWATSRRLVGRSRPRKPMTTQRPRRLTSSNNGAGADAVTKSLAVPWWRPQYCTQMIISLTFNESSRGRPCPRKTAPHD